VGGVVGIWLGFYGGLTERLWILCYDGANCISVWLGILWMETGWANCLCFFSHLISIVMLKGVFCLDTIVVREEFKLMHIGPLLNNQQGIEAKVANVCV
jgi:hypothetical protein